MQSNLVTYHYYNNSTEDDDVEIYEDPIYSMNSIINELSDHFRVSKLSAKIRLSELGFNEAKGSLIY